MPRFSFKTSLREASNGLSLNTPKAGSSTSLFKGSKHESRKDKDSTKSKSSRRRNLGFLKSGIGRTEKSNSDKKDISRRREHAKQLANLAYSEDPTTSIATTTTSASSTNDNSFAYNMNANFNSPMNNNTTETNTSFFAQQATEQSPRIDSTRKTTARPRTGSNRSGISSLSNTSSFSNSSMNDPFGSDPFASFDAFGTSSSSNVGQAKEFSELDLFTEQLGGATTPARQAKERRHQLQQQYQHDSASKRGRRRSSGPVSLDHFFTEDDASTTISQSSNHTGSEMSTIDNSVSNLSKSAAARRRMRSHMQMRQSNSINDLGSVSSAGSGTSNSVSRSRSVPQIPPGSPGMMAKRKNRTASYKNNSNGSWGINNESNHHSPFRSSGSTTSSTANLSVSASSPGVNLFDSDTDNGAGFTFDAFGLDESQVEREVNSAMQDILGDGGFSIFVDKNGSGSESGNGSGSNSVESGSNAGSFRKHSRSYFGNDGSFSGHHSDASEGSFAAQNWDASPNPSRNPSPVPFCHNNDTSNGNNLLNDSNEYNLTREGFVDGFKASPANTPQRPPAKPSSAQQRRLQRRQQQGSTNSIDMTPQRGNSNNSFRQISSEPPAKTKSASDFGTSPGFTTGGFDSPWQEDPFASSDDGGRSSDLFADDNRHTNTARRLYTETQSNVQDYYPSESLTTATNSLLNASTPKQSTPSNNSIGSENSNYARSDVGVSGRVRLDFDSPTPPSSVQQNGLLAPSFFELPPAEECDDQNESDQSDDIDQMQEDLAHEFAKDIVRKTMSPSNDSTGDISNQKGLATRKIQYGDDTIDESEIDDQGGNKTNPQHSNYESTKRYPTQSINNNREPKKTGEPTTKRFGTFRSRYEARKAAASSSSIAQKPTSSNVKNEAGRGSNYRSFRSTYEASRSKPEVSQSIPDEPKTSVDVPKWKQSITQSGDPPIEEKKEEERGVHHKTTELSPPPRKINNLRARWESKTRAPVQNSTPQAQPKISERSDQTKKNIKNMDNSFEMLTPAIMEKRRQARNKEKFINLRKSMGVEDAKTGDENHKSESGGWKSGSSMLDKVLDHVEGESSSKRFQSPNNKSDSKSDIGSPPSYLSNVRLRKVASPASTYSTRTHETNMSNSTVSPSPGPTTPEGRKLNYRERREIELKAQREQEEPKPTKPVERNLRWKERREMETKRQREQEEVKMPEPPPLSQPVEKKMNYRERREMELKLQREQDEKMKLQSPSQTPKKDVASLIRKRISANKKTNSPPQDAHQSSTNSFTSIREPISSNQSDGPSRSTFSTTSGTQNNDRIVESNRMTSPPKNPSKMLENLFASRAPPSEVNPSPKKSVSATKNPHSMLENFLSAKAPVRQNNQDGVSLPNKTDISQKVSVSDDVSQADAKSMLSGFLAKRSSPALPVPYNEDDADPPEKHHTRSPSISPSRNEDEAPPAPPPQPSYASGIPALKDDPKFERYFRMLKMGLPLEVAKHAMVRDGLDPSILDMDHNKPIGIPLKDDPKYAKYFKMLKMGISIEQVKHAMGLDGLNPEVMDQDHSLPAIAVEKKQVKKKKETHRRARLHWKTIGKVLKNSLWDSVQSEIGGISIDEDEFEDLFQADLKASNVLKTTSTNNKKGAAVRVVDSKRANNGGIILARVKLTHDQMADAVDRIDESALTAEQIENVIEYLPTKEERDALEKYMLEGGQDAAEKFDGLCECEKFMVSMMTVKHAKRKIRALLFKLQFMTCMESIAKDAQMIDIACDELINSNRLRQLLGIILQFGNRLNTAGNRGKTKAGGFSLESLSKLSEAKAFDKKTTFLHYIILIVERNNELLLKYYDDIPTVLEAENIFWDQCQQDLEEVENQLENVRRISLHEARAGKNSVVTGVSDDDSLGEMELALEEEVASLRATQTGLFTLGAIKQVSSLREKIEKTKTKCQKLKQYFGVTSKTTDPQEVFSVFVKFTADFKKAKEQVFSKAHKRLREDRKKARQKTPKKKAREPMMKASSHQPNMNQLFTEIQQREPPNSSTRHDSHNETQASRAGLLSSIKERQSPSNKSVPSPQGGPTSDPRAGLFNSIKQRNPASKSGAPADPRAGLLNSIKQRNQSSESGAPADPRAGLLNSIKQRNQSSESNVPADPRAGLLNAIKQRESSENSTISGGENQSGFVTERQPRSHEQNQFEKQVSPRARTPRDAMKNHQRRMNAVRARYGK